MNSTLYRAKVMHHRLEPKKHWFHYNVFMFYLDLDEIDTVCRKIFLMSRNRFNVFNFRDRDHVQVSSDKTKTLREQFDVWLVQHGVTQRPHRVMLTTNLCTWGYQFNPVSFYFCYDENDHPYCAVAEVGNTFREMKLYLLDQSHFDGKRFHLRVPKNFYVSPFIDLDAQFDFQLGLPGEKMNIRIDDYKDERRIFLSTLTGTRKRLTNGRLLGYALRFPLITLKVIGLIHWNALLLWMKKVPWHRKGANPELQQEVMRRYKEPVYKEPLP